MLPELKTNLLYFGDNLEWLRTPGAFPDESVDLVYLDPPFNSNRSYDVLFKESDVRESEAQIHAFEDTWSWDTAGRIQQVYNEFVSQAPERAGQMLKAMVGALGHNDVTAYLTMMAPRLVELHRVLKPTGSLYLHCDPTASHYLKMLLDSIFGPKQFRNEISWKRFSAKNDAGRYGRNHDTILFYARGEKFTWNAQYEGFEDGYVDSNYRYIDEENGRRYRLSDLTANKPGGDVDYEWHGMRPYRGRHWAFSRDNMDRFLAEGRIVFRRTGMPVYKRYLDEMPGVPLQDIWTDLRLHAGSSERLGYPTQKPLVLLERIIAASTHETDVVLDPFCGCGTTVHAAHKLGRRFIGIDVTPLATDLIKKRLEDAFPGLKVPIAGWPADLDGAESLAAQDDKYHFQDWAVIQVGGRPAGGERKKGADRGVDGVIPFVDGQAGPRRGIISVKAGKTGPDHVRDLLGVVTSDDDATFGVLVTLHRATKAMNEAALAAGTWTADFDGQSYRRIQLLSAQDLIDGVEVEMPQAARTRLFAQAARERPREGRQTRLGDPSL